MAALSNIPPGNGVLQTANWEKVLPSLDTEDIKVKAITPKELSEHNNHENNLEKEG